MLDSVDQVPVFLWGRRLIPCSLRLYDVSANHAILVNINLVQLLAWS